MDRSLKALKKIHPYEGEIIKVGYFVKYILKPLSLYLLKILVYTPLTGNQVTLIMLFSGIIGALLIGFKDWALVGCIILQLPMILDSVDGSLARFRKQESKFGLYLDGMFHNLVMPLLFFMLGVYTYNYFNNILYIFLGFGIAFSMVASMYSFFNRIQMLAMEKKVSHDHKSRLLLARFRKNLIQRAIGQIVATMNNFTHIFVLFLIAKIFNFLQYLIFFYFPFYVSIAIVKVFMEFRIAKKELG